MSDFNRKDLQTKKLADFKSAKRKPAPLLEEIEEEEEAEEDEVEETEEEESEEETEEEYEEEEEGSSYFDKVKLLMPIIILAVVCFISYAWYTDKFAISRDSEADLPIVKASTEVLREKPEDPGGMKIINRDKRVYDAISGKEPDSKKPENILPAPEEPLDHTQVAKLTGDTKPGQAPELINKLSESDANNTAASSANAAAEPEKIAPAAGKVSELENVKIADRETPVEAAPAKETAKPVEAEVKPVQIAQATTPAEPAKKPEEAPAPVKIEAKEPAKTEKTVKPVTAEDIKDVAPKKKSVVEAPKKTTSGKSGYRVQLGSYRSQGDADISWKNVKKKFSSIIGDLGNYVEKADLGAKGVYYRLQISGIKSEADARKICQALTEKKQECFFVGK